MSTGTASVPGRDGRRATVVDVAARAGVSPQTVSNVINGRRGFGPATRSRVEEAIAALGFQPNLQARGLRSRRTSLLGLDLTVRQMEVDNPFSMAFVQAIVRAAEARGQHVVVLTSEGGGADLRTTAATRLLDGFVLADVPPEDPRPRTLAELGVPFAVFGRLAPDLPQVGVDIDNAAAIGQAVDHLVATGRRTFAYAGHRSTQWWDVERFDGARARLAAHGLALPAERCLFGTPDEVDAGLRALFTGSAAVDAVVTSSDVLAVVAVQAASTAGLRVGRDLGVTGFDGGPLRTVAQPSLTSVRIPVELIADRLVAVLLDRLAGAEPDAAEVVPTELVRGGSS